MVKTFYLIIVLLALPLAGAAHDWTWLPPQPARGVNPCDAVGNSCPNDLHHIYDNLAEAQQRQDTFYVRYWSKTLRSWYAYNPDYRRHLHPHR